MTSLRFLRFGRYTSIHVAGPAPQVAVDHYAAGYTLDY